MNVRRTTAQTRRPSRWLMPVVGAGITLGLVALAAPHLDRYPWEYLGDDDDSAADLGSDSAAGVPAPDETAGDDEAAEPAEAPEPEEAIDEIRHMVQPGETIGGILGELGAEAGVIDAVVAASAAADYDLSRKLRSGRELRIRMDGEGAIASISFFTDPETVLRLERQDDGSYSGEPGAPRWSETRTAYAARIDSTLWQACMDAGMDPTDANMTAALFDRELDLAGELQPGDRVAVLFETLHLDGEPVRNDGILAARFRRGAEVIELIPWPWKNLGIRGFRPDGTAPDHRFLRSPLDVGRMSSEVGRRNHPVLGGRRNHQGIDYPAPHGTPVRAVGDGRVVKAGDSGGYGIMVVLDHGGNERTRYGHLSRVADDLKPGTRVSKGRVIGFVGSTGLSSGSHLHFEFRRGGKVLDFNRIRPKTEGELRLDGEALERFRTAASERLGVLDAAEAKALVEERRKAGAGTPEARSGSDPESP